MNGHDFVVVAAFLSHSRKKTVTPQLDKMLQNKCCFSHIIMSTMASQVTSRTVVYSTVYSGVDQRKYQSSASLAFVEGIHRWPVNSPHKGPVTQKMSPFDDVIMEVMAACDRHANYHTVATNNFPTISPKTYVSSWCLPQNEICVVIRPATSWDLHSGRFHTS